MRMKLLDSTIGKLLLVIFGGFLYALGMNLFIVPRGLYSGGAVGLAQLLETAAVRTLGISGDGIYGLIYIFINLPLLYVAWKSLGRRFLLETVCGAGSISLFAGMIPVTDVMGLDILSSIIIGGIITGAGIGIILLAGGCGGGLDIVAVWATRKYRTASVGKISFGFNFLLYSALFLISDIKTVIYSLIYMVAFTLIMDRMHFQNINVRLMIFTKEHGVEQQILEKTGRGATKWKGVGGYTGDDTNVIVSCINKYEIREIEELIHGIDPAAFIIKDEGVRIEGNFEKRI